MNETNGPTGTLDLDSFASQRANYVGPDAAFQDVTTAHQFFKEIQGFYAGAQRIGAAQAASTGLIGAMDSGGAQAIASRGRVSADEELLDRAAMESGTD